MRKHLVSVITSCLLLTACSNNKQVSPENHSSEALDTSADIAYEIQAAPILAEKRSMPLQGIMPPHQVERHRPQESGDKFSDIEEHSVKQTRLDPVSTFSIDVDTASYSYVRRQLNNGLSPDPDAVRLEEFVNYFDYQYTLPQNQQQPFKPSVTVSDSPWKTGNKLIHIGIKGYDIEEKQARSHLVFLLDVSGSMSSEDKLPLLKKSIKLLLSQLHDDDTVAVVVYAGAAGTVLEPTAVKEKRKILAALEKLQAGGSTAGGEGLRLAYHLAKDTFEKNAINRVILATDGDFNVGITDPDKLTTFIEKQRESGVYLSVLGFGRGNYNDQLMQQLAQNGNGVAAYIDTLSEAQKVLVHEASSALFPIAQDVKIQVEFNPKTVAEYRLLGYETRILKQEDFNNDKVDAGDIGAGHSVTAIYEITPVGGPTLVDPKRYSSDTENSPSNTQHGDEYAYLKLRYKLPGETQSKLLQHIIPNHNTSGNTAGQFAIAVAGFAQLLKGGKYLSDWSYDEAITLAQQHKGEDDYGYRSEFIQLIRKAKLAKTIE